MSLLSAPESLNTIPEDSIQQDVEEEENEEEEERESPRRGREADQSESQQDASARVAPKDIICRLYKRRNCPYGRTGKTLVDGKQCEKPHPPRCFKYTRFGARDRKGYNKGANCQYCHPRLCNDSVKSQRCSKDECSFFHLKGTLRSRQALDRANNDQSQAPTRRESTIPTTFAPTTPRFSISEATPYPPTVQQWSRQGAPNRNEEAFLLQ